MAVPGRTGRPTIALVALGIAIVVSGALAACAGTPSSPGTSGSAAPVPVDATAARAAIEAAKLDDSASLEAVARFRFTKPGADAARQVLAAGGQVDALWAAIWVYASAAADPAPLKPYLTNGEPSLRVMAAAALVASGDRDGFPVLRDSVADDTALVGSDPPATISGFAVSTLFEYVQGAGAPTPPEDAAQLGAAFAAWPPWLDAHLSAMTYDKTSGTWSAP